MSVYIHIHRGISSFNLFELKRHHVTEAFFILKIDNASIGIRHIWFSCINDRGQIYKYDYTFVHGLGGETKTAKTKKKKKKKKNKLVIQTGC